MTVDHQAQLQHALSPMAIEVLHLLSLSQPAIDALVARSIEENPLLQSGPPRRCRWCAAALRAGRCPGCAGGPGLAAEPAAVAFPVEALRVEARLLVPRRLQGVVDFVIANLDDGGLLKVDRADLAAAASCTDADVDAAVTAIQQAGPPGVATTTATECLLTQAKWHAATGGPALLVPVVDRHLGRVAAGDAAGIASDLGVSSDEVDRAIDFLRRRLRPLAFSVTPTQQPSTPPDVIVRRIGDDQLTVEVLGAADVGLGLDPDLNPILHSQACSEWLTDRASEARLLLAALDRRASALQRVANGAVQAQRAFVLHGAQAHLPLTRTALAAALGLHPSTVSRAIQGSVVALPDRKVVPMADFFGGAVSVQHCLESLLAGDDPPRSDAEAAQRLLGLGYQVARRTIAKYRARLVSSGVASARTSLRNPAAASRAARNISS